MHSFTEAIRAEVDGSGITITSLLPGITDTNILHKSGLDNSKIVEQGLADPADVARDGFDALMVGRDMVVSGFKNKVLVAAANFIPDSLVAKGVEKMQGSKESR